LSSDSRPRCRCCIGTNQHDSGTVKDASGGVLPGVTVEVSSPALIEKTRSTVTSGSGSLFHLPALRPAPTP
jgi:hypothetical protein